MNMKIGSTLDNDDLMQVSGGVTNGSGIKADYPTEQFKCPTCGSIKLTDNSTSLPGVRKQKCAVCDSEWTYKA